jgi:transcription antitermination factor NusG
MHSKPQWYAVYTRSRSEKKVAAEFEKQGIDHYLPLITAIRQWSDRKKRVRVPLINSYVFVHITSRKHLAVLQTFGVVKIVHFCGRPVPVPEYQINNLRILLGAQVVLECEPMELEKGQEVRISKGPLMGLRGIIVMIKGKQKLLIRIDALKCNMTVDVDHRLVELIGPEEVK